MDKKQYLEKLHRNLTGLSKEETEDILRDFDEYFEIGKERQRTEKEISMSLGDPKIIAKQIKAESYINRAEEKASTGNIARAVYTTVGLSFFNLIVILPVICTVFAVLAALYSAAISIGATGISGTVVSFFYPLYSQYLTFSINTAVLIFAFIGLAATGILFFVGNIYLTKFLYRQMVKYLRFNIRIVKGRRAYDEV
jgi:uncharacterized membrane protein